MVHWTIWSSKPVGTVDLLVHWTDWSNNFNLIVHCTNWSHICSLDQLVHWIIMDHIGTMDQCVHAKKYCFISLSLPSYLSLFLLSSFSSPSLSVHMLLDPSSSLSCLEYLQWLFYSIYIIDILTSFRENRTGVAVVRVLHTTNELWGQSLLTWLKCSRYYYYIDSIA